MANPQITKEFVIGAVNKAGEIIKSGITPKKAEDLLKTKKKDIIIGGEKKATVTADGETETVLKLSKKGLKKNVPDVAQDVSDDALFKYNAMKITPKILDDFNIDNIKSKEDVAKFIELISKKYSSEINAQKRGVQTQGATKRLATLLQKDDKQLTATILSLKPGQTLNAEYLLAARELMAGGMVKLDGMAQMISAGKATDLQKVAFRQHFALMSEFQKILKGVQTETARALSQFRIPTRTKNYSNVALDDLNKKELLLELGGGDEITGIATAYLKLGTKNAQMKFTQGAGGLYNLKQSSNAIAEIFINAILSNPMTHIRNTGGNFVSQAIMRMEHKLVARIHGGKVKGGVAAYEDIAKAYGQSMAAQEFLQALSVATKGKKLTEILSKMDELVPANIGGSKVEMRTGQFTADKFNMAEGKGADAFNMLGRVLTLDRLPTKMLVAADGFFKNREYRSELYALAFREAMENIERKTLTQEDAGMFIADRVLNPTKASVEIAKNTTLKSVFQTKMKSRDDALGWIGERVQGLKGQGGYFSWLSNYYIPFTQTPINIAGFVSERTPGLHYLTRYGKDIAAGGDQAQLARMRLQLGTMFYLATASAGYYGNSKELFQIGGSDLDIPGKFTGGKYTLQKGFNFQPNQLRLQYEEGKFVALNTTGLDPISTMIAQAGNLATYTDLMLHKSGMMQDVFNDSPDNETDTSQSMMLAATMSFALSFGENLVNQTALKGAGDAVYDLQNFAKMMSGDMKKGKFAKQWSQNVGKAFVPSFIKQGSKLTRDLPDSFGDFKLSDDNRKLSNEWNTFLTGQFANKDLPTEFNIFGKEIDPFGMWSKFEQGPAERLVRDLMPMKIKKPRQFLSYSPGKLPGMNVTYNMTDKELSFYQYNAGQIFSQMVENDLVDNEDFEKADTLLKHGKIQQYLSQAGSISMAMLKADGQTEYTLPSGAKTIFPKSNYVDDILARGEDGMINKFKTYNGANPLTEETKTRLGINTEQ
jgi:hypothetical protein